MPTMLCTDHAGGLITAFLITTILSQRQSPRVASLEFARWHKELIRRARDGPAWRAGLSVLRPRSLGRAAAFDRRARGSNRNACQHHEAPRCTST